MKDGQWSYNHDVKAETWDCEEVFETRIEAIKGAREAAKDYAHDYLSEEEGMEYLENGSFSVGQITYPSFEVDAEDIIEKIQEQFSEQCGDYAEDWMEAPHISNWKNYTEEQKIAAEKAKDKYKKDITTLEDRLHEVVNKWLVETNNQPNFYSLENIVEYKVKEEAN